MFSLPDFTVCKCVHVNPRAEHHGDELVPEVDLRFSAIMGNAILETLDPALKLALYRNGKPNPRPEPELDLSESDAPHLRFPKLGAPLKWKEEQTGLTLEIDYGLGVLTIEDCKLAKMQLEPMEGGTCELLFTVQTTGDVAEELRGKLMGLVQRDVSLRLLPPEVVNEPELV